MPALMKQTRSAVPGKIPSTSGLDLGQLAINTYDGALYLKRDNGTESIIRVDARKSILDINVNLSTVDTNQVIDTFAVSEYSSAKYLICMRTGSDFHVTEILLAHDGINTYTIEYGTIYNNTILGNISSDIITGNVRLKITPEFTNLSVRMQRIHTGV